MGRDGYTYFLPKQALGPVENGCSACFLSDAYSSESQRSGMKEEASLKLFGLRYAASAVTKTVAYHTRQQRAILNPWTDRLTPGGIS